MIEYVKVKHDEECYICHSRENVKTLRVAADSSNAANTIAFCDKCAGTVSRVLNVPMTFERSREIYKNSDYKNGDDFFSPSAMSHVKDIFKIVPTEKGSDEQ